MALNAGYSLSFREFFNSAQASGLVLIACTLLSLGLANSDIGPAYLALWKFTIAGVSVGHWINDGLMAVFFLLIGLELERELHNGELSDLRNAMLPIFAAIGGVTVPALIHYSLNAGTASQAGIGIPMATDIAFALAALSMLAGRIPPALKIFVVAFAIIDDLVAILVIALFYTAQLSLAYLVAALAVWALLLLMNLRFRVMTLAPYLIGGVLMWVLVMKSGVHATVAGVLLAFAIPFSARMDDERSPSHKLEHWLHKPVAFGVLPLFALANTGIVIQAGWAQQLASDNSLGIMAGLVIGKPAGVLLLCLLAITAGWARLPQDLGWRHLAGAGLLGGIGFTMSIFIANLAFPGDAGAIDSSKIAIMLASLVASLLGFAWLYFAGKQSTGEEKAA